MSNQTDNEPRSHHFVPQFYLRGFADHKGQLAVRRRGAADDFRASTRKIAAENDLYSVIDRGQRSLRFEYLLGTVETRAARVVRAIADGRLPRAGSEDRQALAYFLAIQCARTPELRDRLLFPEDVRRWAGGVPSAEQVRRYLTEVHLGFSPTDNEVEAAHDFVCAALTAAKAPSKEDWVNLIFSMAEQLAAMLGGRGWSLEQTTALSFLTSDNPVVPWRHPSERDSFEGVGYQNAEEVRFALSPSVLLVLRVGGPESIALVPDERVASVNRYAAARCRAAIYAQPPGGAFEGVQLKEKRPVLRFSHGPGYDGSTGASIGDVIHTWVPGDGGPRPNPPS